VRQQGIRNAASINRTADADRAVWSSSTRPRSVRDFSPLNRTVRQSAISRFVGETSADREPFVWPARFAPSPLSSAASKC
jgi:hypothetical protein